MIDKIQYNFSYRAKSIWKFPSYEQLYIKLSLQIRLYKYISQLTIMHSQNKPHANLQTTYNSAASTASLKLQPNQLLASYQQIKLGINTHNYIIHELTSANLYSQVFLSASKKQQIASHCNQYSKIAPLIINLLNGRAGTGSFLQQQNFWYNNEGLQRQLQINLRDLKSLDAMIDNIVNQQFDKCNEIDQIQETIRTILIRKEPGHIAKAQPYFQKKQHCLNYLTHKKQEKQGIKQQKLRMIKKIIQLLEKLRKHRQNGLRTCLIEQKQNKLLEGSEDLINKVITDIKEIQINQHKLTNIQAETQDLTFFIHNIQSRIDKTAKQLLNLIDQQNGASLKLEELTKLRSQTEYFQSSIFSVFGVSNIRRNDKSQYMKQISNILIKLQKFANDNKQKQKQISKIQQGIQTTKKTLDIFANIMQKIQTQNMRKNQLLRDIQKIQYKHSQQDRILSTISQHQNQLQKVKLRKNQLNKNLQIKLNQANLTAYKAIHEQIVKLEQQIKNKTKQIQYNRQSVSQNARDLYDQTIKIQQNYEDILSQIVPSMWLKDGDFTKQDSIKDLNLYLLKTFKRLSITD